MKGPLRKTMTWLHTWSSIVFGWLLFAVFLTGTLSYFRMEMTHWMEPETHVSVPSQQALNFATERLQERAPQAANWSITLPNERSNTVDISWRHAGDNARRRGPMEVLNASTGEPLTVRETRGGDFFYRFHFELSHLPRAFSRTLVEVATMAMFIALITGIIMHRKIFSDFFMFRTKNRSLGWSDAHAVTAVLALPFHLMITFSGLLLLGYTLVFWGNDIVRSNTPANHQERAAIAELTTQLIPVNFQKMLHTAESQLDSKVGVMSADNPLTAAAQYTFFSAERQSLLTARRGQSVIFDAQGEPKTEHVTSTIAHDMSSIGVFTVVLRALHEARFADTVVRWLFFIAGVSGTIMVGSGAILWATKRAKRQAGQFGYELVHTLNIASIAGLCIAVASYFWLNRLLPAEWANRGGWEVNGFFLIWLATLLHAALYRHRKAWQWQLFCAGVLFVLLPLLDHFTSPVTLWSAALEGDVMRLSFDAVCLVSGTILLSVAAYLRNKPQSAVEKNKARPVSTTTSHKSEVIAK